MRTKKLFFQTNR